MVTVDFMFMNLFMRVYEKINNSHSPISIISSKAYFLLLYEPITLMDKNMRTGAFDTYHIYAKACFKHARIQRGGGTGGLVWLLKNHKNIGFISNNGSAFPENTKLSSQHSMLGHHWPVTETPFKWRFAGGPMTACLLWLLGPPSPRQLKNNNKKTLSLLGPL